MVQKNLEANRGIIRTIILIVIALLILSYFGLNLRSIVNSPTGQDNFSYTKELVLNTWNKYLKSPATYLWNDIFIKLIWEPAIDNLTKIKNGEQTDFQTQAPTVN